MSRSKPPPRLYVSEPIHAHGVCLLPPEQSHHLSHVLRLAAGDAVTVFDGRGSEYDAIIARVSKSGITLNMSEPRAVDRESPLDVTLAQGISSGDRMDYTVQKAVELGISAVQPLATERSVVRLNPERALKRVAHWQAIAIASCEQCGRNRVPEVLPVQPFTAWLGAPAESALRLTLAPGAALKLAELDRPQTPIVLIAGPEGGLSPREREDATRAGCTSVRLGPRVLRTETAAVAALAALQTLWGDF